MLFLFLYNFFVKITFLNTGFTFLKRIFFQFSFLMCILNFVVYLCLLFLIFIRTMVNCTWNDSLESSILGYPVGGFSVRIIFYNYIDIHKANNVLCIVINQTEQKHNKSLYKCINIYLSATYKKLIKIFT